ncbi:MAG: hypothetical protein DWQ01_11995 [Planctomycetota bacterium]|nr:MAG: hypothetical protein DWQ01_11995 [Planctomycetota bacterium]
MGLPISRPTIQLPGCKSLSARVLLTAASSSGVSRLKGLSEARDTRELIAALEQLGVAIQAEADQQWRVEGLGKPAETCGLRIDVGEGGSTFRFLTAWLAAGNNDVVLEGAASLFARPHQPLLDFLERHGARFETASAPSGRKALRLLSSGLQGGLWRPPIRPSSQYLSAALLASAWSGPIEVQLPGVDGGGELPSSGYLDLTLEVLRAFRGPLAVQARPGGFHIQPGAGRAGDFVVGGDPSGATFFLVALILTQGAARLQAPWSAVHPEARLLRHLFDAGLLEADQDGVQATGRNPSFPLKFDLEQAPDAGPALAVLGAFLPEGLTLERVDRLRHKESDRVEGILKLLQQLGRPVRLDGNQLQIPPATPPPSRAGRGTYHPQGDHRLAMAAGLAQLQWPDLTVAQPSCVDKSFPGFWDQLQRLVASLD